MVMVKSSHGIAEERKCPMHKSIKRLIKLQGNENFPCYTTWYLINQYGKSNVSSYQVFDTGTLFIVPQTQQRLHIFSNGWAPYFEKAVSIQTKNL